MLLFSSAESNPIFDCFTMYSFPYRTRSNNLLQIGQINPRRPSTLSLLRTSPGGLIQGQQDPEGSVRGEGRGFEILGHFNACRRGYRARPVLFSNRISCQQQNEKKSWLPETDNKKEGRQKKRTRLLPQKPPTQPGELGSPLGGEGAAKPTAKRALRAIAMVEKRILDVGFCFLDC